MARDVVVIVGSIRKDSLNRKLAHALIEIAPAGLKLEDIPIGQSAALQSRSGGRAAESAWTEFRALHQESRRGAVRNAGA